MLIYPNPSNGNFTIDYKLEKQEETTISIISLTGKRTEIILNEKKDKGEHSLNWQNNNLPAGTYFIKISNNKKTITKK